MLRRSLLPFVLGCIAWPLSAEAQANTPAGMPPNSWLAIPNTKLEAVAASPTQFPGIQGNGFYTIIDAWNGALLDTKRNRLVIWGGGHNDYWGNEMYVFDISALAWSRITDPTLNWNNCGDPNADGTASSRHTYNGLSYIAHADRLFVAGGALNCRAGGCGGALTWTFDFESKQWRNMQPTGTHTTGCENNSSYDPATKRVYFGDSNGLYAYSYDTNAWARLNNDSIYGMTSTIDTKRGLLVMAGNRVVWAYDIANNNFTKQVWTTTGGDAFLDDASPGFTYDPVTDRLVGWDGGPVYVLDPTTKAFTSNNPPGAPVRTEQGIFGRFRYVPSVNAFILVTKTNLDVHFYKLSAGSSSVDGGAAGAGGTSADSGAPDAPGAGGSSGSGATGGAATGGTGTGGTGGTGTGGTGTGGTGTGGTATGGSANGGKAGTAAGARGGTAGNKAAPGSNDDSSCACRLAPAKRDSLGWLSLLLLGSLARGARRRVRRD